MFGTREIRETVEKSPSFANFCETIFQTLQSIKSFRTCLSSTQLWLDFLARLARANAKSVARELSNALCGLEMTLPMAWFVEERHTLALALGGEYDTVGAPFRDCHEG